MSDLPSLVSQKAIPSSELALWDYTFTLIAEEDTPFEVLWNETLTAGTDRTPIVHVDGDARTIVFERLDLRDVQCARASAQGVTFPAPVAPSIEIVEPVAIADLAAFLATLLGRSSTWPIEIRCFYVFVLDGAPITMPVVLVPRQDVAMDDASLFEQIDSSVQQWLAAAQPPTKDARLSFAITVWSTVAEIEQPLLRITDASLPLTGVA